jgi:hypothetical protein
MGNKECNIIDKEDDNCYSDNENSNNFKISKIYKSNTSRINKMNRSIDCIINKEKKNNKLIRGKTKFFPSINSINSSFDIRKKFKEKLFIL